MFKTLTIGLLAISTASFAGGTSGNAHLINPDSVNFYLQKGITEKDAGRLQVSLKHFEKAISFDSGNKAVLAQLAPVYFDLRKYQQSKDTYKQLVELGEGSA